MNYIQYERLELKRALKDDAEHKEFIQRLKSGTETVVQCGRLGIKHRSENLWKDIKNAIEGKDHITEILAYYFKAIDHDTEILKSILNAHPEIHTLRLRCLRCNTEEGGINLAKIFADNNTLKTLDFNWIENILTNQNVKFFSALFEHLKTNVTAEKLSLNGCEINDKLGIEILGMLLINNTLIEIDLGHNKLDAETIKDINASLLHNASMANNMVETIHVAELRATMVDDAPAINEDDSSADMIGIIINNYTNSELSSE